MAVSFGKGLNELDFAAERVPAVLQSSRRRSSLAAVLFFVLALMVPVAAYLPGAWPTELVVPLRNALAPLVVMFLAMLGFELMMRQRITRMIEGSGVLDSTVCYLTIFVENSLPTLVIMLLAGQMGLGLALASPAPLLYPLFVFMSVLYLKPGLSIFAGAVAAVQFGLVALIYPYEQSLVTAALVTDPAAYVIKCGLILCAGFVAAFLANELCRQMDHVIRTAHERDHAVSIFGQHVSPEVAERLLEQDLEVHSEEREACVMFLDIRNFSGYATNRSPCEVMDYLNTLFTPLIGIVNTHEGIVNKFLGDGFMAVFGAPIRDDQQCRHAVGAAMAILECLESLNREGAIPSTRIGIGLHAGPLMTGNVGTSRRKEYTLIGDTVNIASRIEQATKEHGCQLLISEAVRKCVDDDDLVCTPVGRHSLKGIKDPVMLYRLG